jgi:lambda family phage portal protein
VGRPKKVAPQATNEAAKQARARYDAAGTGRRMAGWTPPQSGPNTAITGVQKVRDRSRDSVRNDWSGASGVQKWTTNLIGTGIVPRWKTEKGRKAWDKWVPQSDADGVLNFYGQETLATRTWLDGGECFGRLRFRRSNSGLEVPMQVQLLEPEYVPMLDTDAYPNLPKGHTIRSGIERNNIGQRTAFWMYREHPGDGFSRQSIDPSRLLRVPAAEVIHMYDPQRPGQLRGVSSLAPILVRLRNIADYDDAVLDRQKLANLFTMFITRAMPATDVEFDPDTGLPHWFDNEGNKVAKLQPGMSQELLPGEDVKFANPPEAGTTFSDYMRTQHMGTAAGQGLPYELFSGDIREISDRTLRVIVNEFHRFAEQRQWQIIIPQFCAKVAAAWANAAVVAGTLSQADVAEVPVWSPHGWQYLHPVQDVEGKVAEVNAGFRSRSSVISERGDDPATVDAERAEDQKRAKKLDLFVEPPAAGAKKKPGDEPPPPTTKAMTELTARVTSLGALIEARAGEQAPAPTFHITNNIPPTQVEVTNSVEPTPVVIENNVAAPDVTIENNVGPTPVVIENNVAAPAVTVENNPTIVAQAGEVTVNLPDRKTETEVTRNGKGEITKTIQLETTVGEQPTKH